MDSWRTWDLVRPYLGDDVLAPALPGHLGGRPLRGDFDLAADVERALDAAGVETAHLVGNSLGGYLALLLAARGRATLGRRARPGGRRGRARRDARDAGDAASCSPRSPRARSRRDVVAAPHRRGPRLRRGAADRQRARARLAAGSVAGRLPRADRLGHSRTSCSRTRAPPRATGAHCTPTGSSSRASATRPSSTSRSRRLSSSSASCEAGPRPARIWTRSQTELAIHRPRPPSCSWLGRAAPGQGIVDPPAVAQLADHACRRPARCAGCRARRRAGCCWRPPPRRPAPGPRTRRGSRPAPHSSVRRRTSASVSSSKPSTRAWAGGGASGASNGASSRSRSR